MTDWNPAEIIGNNPNLLDYSLYDYLLMNNSWYLGRKKLNYSDIHNKELMVKFGNKPYVDIRSSFLSLIPKNIPKKLQQKLLFFYYKKLQQNTHLHDKAEFEILFSCYEPIIENRLYELKAYNFSILEIKELKKYLLDFTNDLIDNFDHLSKECMNSISLMQQNRIKIHKNLNKTDRKYDDLLTASKFLLEDCKNFGAIPFSLMARIAFVSSIILKNLVKNKKISDKSVEIFMNSIDSPLSRFQTDQLKLNNNKLSKKEFFIRYGHLRPGTYDITAARYDQNPLVISDIKIRSKTEKITPTLNNTQKILKNSGLDLLDSNDKSLQPVRYRAIIKTSNPKEIINSLELEGVKAIIPTEDWEILGNSSLFPNSLKLSRETVSIPLYPSLTNDEIDLILSVLIKK